LADRLKAMTPDVVVSHHVWPLVVFGPVLKTFNSPVCVYLHGPMSGSGFLERSAARQRPSRVIGVSRHTLASFRPYFPAVPSEVIHYPMPFPARDFEMTCEDKQQLRESLRTSRDSIVILQASRIEERKGLDNLLTALHSLLDIPNWVCWIAGGSQRSNEAKYLVALQRQTSILGLENRVRFLGERQDVQRLMGTSDIYCQGNRGPEGFSLAFLEALSASLPIVTTAIGGAPEMIDDSCGRLVTVDKPTALSDRLRELISDVSLRQRLGAAGAKRARQLSDPVNQLERIRSAFTSTIASHDPDRESCKVLPVVADKRRERMSV
jgi:glycosyltransferase involved in cell wall biosynthesis